jgi:branched-chain amino acid transport system permease protein
MLSQLIVNGFIAGATYTLIGLSFAIIYLPSRFLNFSHGAIYTLGAYGTLAAMTIPRIPLQIAILIGIIFSASVGVVIELIVYRPLRKRNSNLSVLLLVSLGIYIVLQNTISLFFGDYIQSIRFKNIEDSIVIFSVNVTISQIWILTSSIILTVSIAFLLKTTAAGKAIRATASNPMLAYTSGLNIDKIILGAFLIGSALAGGAGILIALDSDITPTMGMNALMMGVVAMVVGGVNSISGVALGALLIGMAQQLGGYYVSSQWQDAIAFIVLLLFLLLRPQGFFGKKIRKAEV